MYCSGGRPLTRAVIVYSFESESPWTVLPCVLSVPDVDTSLVGCLAIHGVDDGVHRLDRCVEETLKSIFAWLGCLPVFVSGAIAWPLKAVAMMRWLVRSFADASRKRSVASKSLVEPVDLPRLPLVGRVEPLGVGLEGLGLFLQIGLLRCEVGEFVVGGAQRQEAVDPPRQEEEQRGERRDEQLRLLGVLRGPRLSRRDEVDRDRVGGLRGEQPGRAGEAAAERLGHVGCAAVRAGRRR